MSIVIVSGEQISKSPLNTSNSKQMYSFPREERFGYFKKKLGSSDNFYHLPSVLSKRSTSFGYGTKSDFTKHFKFNDSTSRYIPTDFNEKQPNSPAFTFGIARQFFEKVYNESDKYRDKNIPGPGTYRYVKPFGYEGRKISFGDKLDKKNLSFQSRVPGPGQYKITSLNPEGKYPFSKFRNTASISFGNSKDPRFNYKDKNKVPGPGTYKSQDLINGQGVVFNSKYHSNLGKTMCGKFFNPKSKGETPGPGQYRAFSEFGIYGSKNVKTEANKSINFSIHKNSPLKTSENL